MNHKLRLTIEVFGIIIMPAFFILLGSVILNIRTAKLPKQLPQPTPTLSPENGLNPKEIIDNVFVYDNKDITIKGTLAYGESSCLKKSCPSYDQCCGCDDSRDIVLKDTSVPPLFAKVIKVYNPGRSPICHRKQNSCDYDCNDWSTGSIYKVTGTFVLVRPLGLGLTRGYLEYYLEVKDKTQLIAVPTPSPFQENFLDITIKRFLPMFLPKEI